MQVDSLFNSQMSGKNVGDKTLQRFSTSLPSKLYYRWGLYGGSSIEPVAYGQVDYFSLARQLANLQKLHRQHREHLAAVTLDPTAQRLLGALDRETSIRWEDLPDTLEGNWSELCRAAAILAGSNLCEAGPTRIRLSEYGDKLLTESSSTNQAHAKIAG